MLIKDLSSSRATLYSIICAHRKLFPLLSKTKRDERVEERESDDKILSFCN